MRQQTTDNIMAFICGLLLFACIFMSFEALAGGYDKDAEASAESEAKAIADAAADATAEATGGSATASTGDSSASNEGNSLVAEGDSVENNSSNVVLVPNNNTESCVRVFGLAFGKNGESAAIGWPWRSRACDFEQAADDAFAAGERDLGWFWKCQNKNVARPFRLDGMSWDEAKHECHKKAVGAGDAYAVIDELRSKLEILEEDRQAKADEVQRLNGVLTTERNDCKKQKDAITKGCFGGK